MICLWVGSHNSSKHGGLGAKERTVKVLNLNLTYCVTPHYHICVKFECKSSTPRTYQVSVSVLVILL